MKKPQIKIVLAGEGGQGIQTIAKIVALAALSSDYKISYLPSFGVEQRGTPSIAFLIIGSSEINYPRFNKAEYVVILQKRAISSVAEYIDAQTTVIFDSSTIDASSFGGSVLKLFGIPATQMASDGSFLRSFNVLMAGKLCQILGLDQEKSWESVVSVLGKKFKTEGIKQSNQRAFNSGWRALFENKIFTVPSFNPSKKEQIFENEKRKGRVVPDRCKGCGLCLEVCPVGAIKFSSKLGLYGTPIPMIDIEKCIACGKCSQICPDVAIKVERKNPPK